MARWSPIQSNFNSGQFSPMLDGRVDADRYKSGLKLSLNAIPTLQGPVLRRSGSRFVAPAVNNNLFGSVLIPFKYSNTQSYMLEFSPGQIGFFTQEQQLVSAPSVPYRINTPYTLLDLTYIKWTQSLDVLYLVNPNYRPFKLNRFGSIDWTLTPINFNDGPYLDLGLDKTVCQVTSIIHVPKMMAITNAVGTSQITTICGDYASLAVNTITNNGSGACRVTFVDADEFGDRSQIYIYGATGTTGANGTWVAKKISTYVYDLVGSTFNAAYTGGGKVAPAPFKPGTYVDPIVGTTSLEYNRCFRMNVTNGTTPWGWGRITSIDGSNTIGATANVFIVKTVTTANVATPNFLLGSWCQTLGWPSCVGFHDDRLYFGSGLQHMDGSNTSDYENFQPTEYDTLGTIVDSNAVSFTINSNDANALCDFTSDEYGIPILSSGGPFVMRPSALNEAITPTNVSVKRVDSVGAANIRPVYAGKSTIYLSSSSRKIYELTYYYNIDGFRKIDLTEIAESLPDLGITTNLVFQQVPQPILWCGREDGTFLGMTFDRNMDALRTGWSTHRLGGVGDNVGSAPLIESFGVIPSSDGTTDEVWFIVKRYINGAAVRYVEYFEKIFEDFNLLEDAFMVDCGATFDSPLAPLSITAANPAVVTSNVAHGLTTGDKVRFENIVGLVDASGNDLINNIQFSVTVLTTTTFSLNGLNATGLTPFILPIAFPANKQPQFRKQVSTISGLKWLEGETVSILGDGATLNDAVVDSSGNVALSFPAGKVQVGLKYKTQIQMLRLEAGSADGTSIGKTRRIEQLSVLLNRSSDFKVGSDFVNMDTVIVRDSTNTVNTAAPLFTGIKDKITIQSDYDVNNTLCFEIDTPTPFMLCAVMPQQTTQDKT